MRIGAHAAGSLRGKVPQFGLQAAGGVKQVLWPVALHPSFEYAHVVWIFVHLTHGHLVRAPITFGALAIDFLWAGPAFRSSKHDHRPSRPLRESILARVSFD